MELYEVHVPERFHEVTLRVVRRAEVILPLPLFIPPPPLLVQQLRLLRHHLAHRRDPTNSTSTEVSEEDLRGEGPSDGEELSEECGGNPEGEVVSDGSGVGEEEEEQEPSDVNYDASFRSVALFPSIMSRLCPLEHAPAHSPHASGARV
jgi:hypothetical protein